MADLFDLAALKASKMKEVEAGIVKEILAEAIDSPDLTISELANLLNSKDVAPFKDLTLHALRSTSPTKQRKPRGPSTGKVRLSASNKEEFKEKVLGVFLANPKEYQGSTAIQATLPDLSKPQLAGIIAELVKDGLIEHNGKAKGGSAYKAAEGKQAKKA